MVDDAKPAVDVDILNWVRDFDDVYTFNTAFVIILTRENPWRGTVHIIIQLS